MGSVTAQIVGDDDKNNSVSLSKWGFYEDFGQRETGENVVFFFFKVSEGRPLGEWLEFLSSLGSED